MSFLLLGPMCVKAARKMLMKLTPCDVHLKQSRHLNVMGPGKLDLGSKLIEPNILSLLTALPKLFIFSLSVLRRF